MVITGVVPKGFTITTEFSLQQAIHLRDFLSRSHVEFDGVKEPEMASASKYVSETLFPTLNDLCDSIAGGR